MPPGSSPHRDPRTRSLSPFPLLLPVSVWKFTPSENPDEAIGMIVMGYEQSHHTMKVIDVFRYNSRGIHSE